MNETGDLYNSLPLLSGEESWKDRATRAEAERDANARTCDRFAAQRDRLASDALCELSAAGIATPEQGYVVEPSCLKADIAKLRAGRDWATCRVRFQVIRAEEAEARLKAVLDCCARLLRPFEPIQEGRFWIGEIERAARGEGRVEREL